MLFPSTNIINVAPMDVYYHNNDISMLLSSISTPFSLNCQLIVVFDGNDNLCIFLHRVGNVVQPFLPLQSAKPSSIMILESRDWVGYLWKWCIAPLCCAVALM